MKNLINSHRNTLLSWGITLLVVIGLLGSTFWYLQLPPRVAAPIFEEEAAPLTGSGGPVAANNPAQNMMNDFAIGRKLTLKTVIPERPRYEVIKRTVQRGDSIFGISTEFDIKPDSLLWANYETLKDDPHSLRPGMELNIPPINGVYYQWQEADTLDSVAAALLAKPEDILNWPGNKLDLAEPKIAAGTWVMVPDGEREYQQWIVPTIAVGRSGTSGVGGSACGAGSVGSGGFTWPTANRFLSGNDYYSGHLAIDIAAGEGSPVYAADSGVVTMAAGGWNGGYGNVVQINHGNGYATLYAHLSVINVSVCQSVGRGQTVGAAGNTGNSFGAHLHFEVRLNGGFVNPWYVLP
ncbi:MAG: M23 family metallopeptidase [Anaerolineales bacterium]|jgi:murein DD-endopeptidase MepM/ murein hydrolase activator NlpD|nr:M23 family metallopeptidase [Anaerolineales bacterium]